MPPAGIEPAHEVGLSYLPLPLGYEGMNDLRNRASRTVMVYNASAYRLLASITIASQPPQDGSP